MKVSQCFQLEPWNILIFVSLMSFLLTVCTARTVHSTQSTPSTVTTDLLEKTGIAGLNTDFKGQVDSILKSVERNQFIGKSTYHPDVHSVPDELSNVKLDIKPHISTDSAHTDAQTTAPTDDENEKSPTKFNFAIIAALGALVLVIVLCIKCCNWFRAYTRAGDKEDSTKYAAIIHTGDDEYGHVDIQSDTASTVYLDTISSYQSFLKRNEHNSSMTSSKFTRQNSGSPTSKANGRPAFKDLDVRYMEMRQIRTGSRAETPDTCSPRSESAMSDNIRTFSVSSEETEPSTGTISTSNNEEVSGKKQQIFKVSFTTDNKSLNVKRPERQRSFNRSSLKHLSVDRHRRSLSCRSTVSRLSYTHDNAFQLKPINQTTRSTAKGSGIDVATQTNRSFTYSRWKSRKRHYSDSGVDEMLGPPTINELSSISSYTDNCGHSCVSPDSTINRTNDQVCDQNINRHVLNEEKNRNRITCENSISESESSDEVFATDVLATCGVNDKKHVSDSFTFGRCVKNIEKIHSLPDFQGTKTNINIRSSISSSDPDVYYKQKNHVVKSSAPVGVLGMPHTSNDRRTEVDIIDSYKCSKRRNLVTDNVQKYKSGNSGTTIDMFLINERDIIDKDTCNSYELDGSLDDVTCSTVSGNAIPVDVYKLKDGISKLKNSLNDSHSLIIEQDMTSSMTSLESSGYAEISSDASTS